MPNCLGTQWKATESLHYISTAFYNYFIFLGISISKNNLQVEFEEISAFFKNNLEK